MKISTIENIHKRCAWLQSVWDGSTRVSVARLEQLRDMKAFCTLEIDSLFTKVSYNTIKNFCSNNELPGVTHSSENLWEYIRSLREKIYITHMQANADRADEKPSATMMINEAYNQAQLATIAYLDLFKFVKTLLETDSTINSGTRLQIANFLFESSLKFECISTMPASAPKIWSVIQGGKERV